MQNRGNHKNLKVWQKSIDLVDLIYDLTANFPKDEVYGLSSQIKRSAISVPSNISEGNARSGKKEFSQILNIAIGSLAELETQCLIAHRRKFVDDKNYAIVCSMIDEIFKMLIGLKNSLTSNI
jgi:four helix bundle protein